MYNNKQLKFITNACTTGHSFIGKDDAGNVVDVGDY